MADEHGVDRQTLHRDAKFAGAVIETGEMVAGFREKALSGDLPKRAVAEIARLDDDEREDVARQIVDGEAASVKDARKQLKCEQRVHGHSPLGPVPAIARPTMCLAGSGRACSSPGAPARGHHGSRVRDDDLGRLW